MNEKCRWKSFVKIGPKNIEKLGKNPSEKKRRKKNILLEKANADVQMDSIITQVSQNPQEDGE
jgi:hypothetical protein